MWPPDIPCGFQGLGLCHPGGRARGQGSGEHLGSGVGATFSAGSRDPDYQFLPDAWVPL